MENNPTVQAGAPAPAAPVVAPVAAPVATPPQDAPKQIDVKALIASMSPEERRLAASGRLDQIKGAATAAPVVTTEATTPAVTAAEPSAPPATVATEAELDTDAESDAGPGEAAAQAKSKRVRLTDEKDQAIYAFARANGITFREAALRLEPSMAPATAAEPGKTAAPATPAAPVVDPVVAEIDAKMAETDKRIEKLKADRKKASEDLDSEKVIDLSDELSDLKLERRLMGEAKEKHVTTTAQAQKRAVTEQTDAARDRVFSEYPVLNDEHGMERMALDAFIIRARHERPEEFKDPSWPYKLTKEFATKHKIQGTSAPAAAPNGKATTPALKTQPRQVAAVSGSKLLTGSDGRQSSAPSQMTREEALALVRSDPRGFMRSSSQIFAGSKR